MDTGTVDQQARALSLRERKKLRTRRALIETAVELFTAKGFDGATLDELVDSVEVSLRTFFRNFTSKEDVALAPEKEFWSTYVAEISSREVSGPVLATLQGALFTTLDRMSDDWERLFLASRKLAEVTPALDAHSRQHCARTTEEARKTLGERLGVEPDDLRLRIALELMLAAWHCALHDWSTGPDEVDRTDLVRHMGRAFAAVPESLTLSAE